jgi:dienelactone hydrolase
MKIARAFIASCVLTAPLAGQTRLAGDWQGQWLRAGDTLPVTMQVRRDSNPGRYTATFGSSRLRVSGIPFNSVDVTGCCDVSMTLRGDRTTMVFTGRLRADSLTGTFQEGTTEGRFAFARSVSARPAFDEKEITFNNGTVTLAGSLLLPSGNGPFPAVVFQHGSGAEGRWASRFLAAELATRGIAALIYDKRGVGRSAGDWRQAAPEDLAADGAAAVAAVQREPRIRRDRIGVYGHSQGGTLLPMVVTPDVAFVIGSAAAGVPTDSVEIFSVLNSVYPRAVSAADSASANAYVAELVSVAYHGRPRARLDSLADALRDRPWFFAPPAPDNAYWKFSPVFARYRPLEWWPRVRVPVLLLYGAADQRVPASESAARIAAALLRAGNTDVTVKIFPRADHTFRLPPGPSGWPSTPADYVPTIVSWVARQR